MEPQTTPRHPYGEASAWSSATGCSRSLTWSVRRGTTGAQTRSTTSTTASTSGATRNGSPVRSRESMTCRSTTGTTSTPAAAPGVVRGGRRQAQVGRVEETGSGSDDLGLRRLLKVQAVARGRNDHGRQSAARQVTTRAVPRVWSRLSRARRPLRSSRPPVTARRAPRL